MKNRAVRAFFVFLHPVLTFTKTLNKNIMAKELKDLTKRSENYSQWYNDLVVKADLAEQSAVRGCMVIKPFGVSNSFVTMSSTCFFCARSSGE